MFLPAWFSTKNQLSERTSRVLFYSATLEVPKSTARTISGWLKVHRKKNDQRPWQRAASCWKQTIMLLRWLKDGTSITTIARDVGISPASGYRYIHEALDVVAEKSPTLAHVLKNLTAENEPFICLDGTLIHTDRIAQRNPKNRRHLWYSGKHKAFGGNIQVITNSTGYPVWVSPVTPGSTHDLTAARHHVLPVLQATTDCPLVLADKGYQGAGGSVKTPAKGPNLSDCDKTYNLIHTQLRSPAERANAFIKHFKALQKVTLCPRTITNIAKTALTVLHLNHTKT